MSMREAAIPSRQTANRSFISLLPPFFLFCEMTAGRSGSIPLWTGALCRIRTGAGFVKNLSKYVQESFTIKGAGYDILSLSEGKTPFLRRTPFTPCFLSFTFSFYPLFHFALVCTLFPAGSRVLPFYRRLLPGRNKSFTGYSKSVHTFSTAAQYTKYVSKGSRNPPLASQPIFYFSFTPLFQICVVNRQSAAVPFPPTGSGALLVLRRNPIPHGQKNRAEKGVF